MTVARESGGVWVLPRGRLCGAVFKAFNVLYPGGLAFQITPAVDRVLTTVSTTEENVV